jgi:hypothetical protein
MEEKTEEKKRNSTGIKKGALLLLALAFILFNASKLFSYIGTKHTVDTEPYVSVPKTFSDSLVKDKQKKIDSLQQLNDSAQRKLIIQDTLLLKKSDTIRLLKKKGSR